jgi:phosphoglycolate phosphatase-like HAD superfamily hydrolase
MRAILSALTVALVLPLVARGDDPLPSWKDTPTKQAIVDFVNKVTAKDSPNYVPPAERIATFDNDGTLWCEQPGYVQLLFVVDRVKAMAPDHPEWKTEEPFKSLLAGDKQGVAASGEQGLVKLVTTTHAGMTTSEFEEIVVDWMKTTKHPKFNRPFIECVYAPQVELLAYLRANGFKTFIVSGGGADFMRPWTEEVYGIPPEQVVGSTGKTKYEYKDGKASIIKLPEIDFIDDKAGKPVGIHKFIGRRPILAFGNSDGDFQMLEYVTSGEGPSSLGLIVHHDDAEREYAYDRNSNFGKLARGLDEGPKRGWVIVSMKDDWAKIFP